MQAGDHWFLEDLICISFLSVLAAGLDLMHFLSFLLVTDFLEQIASIRAVTGPTPLLFCFLDIEFRPFCPT